MNVSGLPLRLGAVLSPAHMVDSAKPELIGPGRCESAHRYVGHGGVHLRQVDLPWGVWTHEGEKLRDFNEGSSNKEFFLLLTNKCDILKRLALDVCIEVSDHLRSSQMIKNVWLVSVAMLSKCVAALFMFKYLNAFLKVDMYSPLCVSISIKRED